jgi:hypothetical protein
LGDGGGGIFLDTTAFRSPLNASYPRTAHDFLGMNSAETVDDESMAAENRSDANGNANNRKRLLQGVDFVMIVVKKSNIQLYCLSYTVVGVGKDERKITTVLYCRCSVMSVVREKREETTTTINLQRVGLFVLCAFVLLMMTVRVREVRT